MFEGMTEQEARAQILAQVREYAQAFHGANAQPPIDAANQQPFTPGERINYAGRIYDADEMENLVDAALEFWLTSGHYTDEFERGLADFLGVPYVSMVNSGSSANMLAIAALAQPELGVRAIKPGDEVITVACGFPTTVTPIIQHGAVPVFVDVTLPDANIDAAQLKEALTAKTKAVMVAHTLGNPFNLQAVREFCDVNGLWLIEDNCDSLGSTCTINGETHLTGTLGDIGTSSFYPPHHMTTGEGGAVYTSNPKLHRIVRSLRDWGRDCVCSSGEDNHCGQRFSGQFGELPQGYDHKYVYSHFGHNLKATDLQAAIGCAQLKKLPGFVEARKRNFAHLHAALERELEQRGVRDMLILPSANPNTDPSWFGFLITCQSGISRKEIVEHLESHGIQTRALFAGNLVKHPCFDAMREARQGYRIANSLENTDRIMEDSFWVGVYPGMTDAKLDYMAQTIAEAVVEATR